MITAFLLLSSASGAATAAQQDNLRAQAEALYEEGRRLLDAGHLKLALSKFVAALPFYQRSGDRLGEAVCLLRIGTVKEDLSEFDDALKAYGAGLEIWQVLGIPEGAGTALNNIGGVYTTLGRYEEALVQLRKALQLKQQTRDPRGEAMTWSNMGVALDFLGRYREALEHHEKALSIQQAIPDSAGQATTLNNIAAVYVNLGQYEEALARFQEALAIQQAISDVAGQGTTLSNIGGVYDALGRYEDALSHYASAMAIAQAIGDRRGEASRLNNLGALYDVLGRYDGALARYQAALAIWQDIGDPEGQATTLSNIGVVHLTTGRYGEALDQFEVALDIQRNIGDQAGQESTLTNIGAVYVKLGRYEAAMAKYEKALAIERAIGDRAREAITLNNMGFLHDDQGQIASALDFYRQAVEVVESIQEDVQVEELASAFASSQMLFYGNLVELLAESGNATAAFTYAERARARAFLNQIGNQSVDFRHGAAEDLLKEERNLRERLIGLKNALRVERAKHINERTQALLETLSTSLEQTRNAYGDLLMRLKLASPEYASLVSVNTLDLQEVQREVLDEETTLIEYFVTDDHTLAWVIDQESFELVTLKVSADELRNKIEFLRDMIATREFDRKRAGDLYESLFAPLKTYIRSRNLVIVAHGVLHYLPFATLWNAKGRRYLLEDYTLTYAPSASVLKFSLAKRNANLERVLVLGNPDGSLPHAQEEAEAIAGLYGTAALTGARATESAIYARAGRIDILHLAAHGVYDGYNPLFTRVELAGDSEADGNLEVHEVFGLDMTGVNLVVLSACETALGKRSEGDELVGLTRAFMYAGAPAVVTTLWKIDEVASAELMEAFYRHLRDEETTAGALQAAQLEVMRQEKWNTPYFWAAFTLTGDYQGNWESE